MKEIKKTFGKLVFYYFLMLISSISISEIIPNSFPFRSLSSLVLLPYPLCLYVYYKYRISQNGRVKDLMCGIAAMLILLILFRSVKYSVFTEIQSMARQMWYLYYMPLLLIPQLFLLTALYIYSESGNQIPSKWMWTAVFSVLLIFLVLTNDLHQQVFIFNPGFENWDSDYSLGIGFYILTVWEYSLYIASVIILLIKCRISAARKQAWLILIPFTVGVVMLMLLAFGRMPKLKGQNVIEFPEVIGFMVAGILECCLQIGLIPTNECYRELMEVSSIAAQITDSSGVPIYKSAVSCDLTYDMLSVNEKALINKNTLLRKMELPGGFGFWQEDITELNRLNDALAEVRAQLSEETELIRLKNRLKEKQAKIEQHNLLYDLIAQRAEPYSLAITKLTEIGAAADEPEKADEIRKHITLLGVYIKRYANLMLLSGSTSAISINELGLAIAESLHYLNYYGIPGELLNSAAGDIPCNTAMSAYAIFGSLLENNLSSLNGIYVNLSVRSGAVLFKINLECANTSIPEEYYTELKSSDITAAAEQEDDITYFILTLPMGGETE